LRLRRALIVRSASSVHNGPDRVRRRPLAWCGRCGVSATTLLPGQCPPTADRGHGVPNQSPLFLAPGKSIRACPPQSPVPERRINVSIFRSLRNRKSCSARERLRKPIPFRPRLEALEDRWLPSTLTVLNNLDSGPGSLRADIAAAQSGDTIVFDT